MNTRVNSKGTDWLVLKDWILGRIEELHRQMELLLSPEEYHQLRGSILALREIMEMVEPSRPAQTTEDTYGISTGDEGSY